MSRIVITGNSAICAAGFDPSAIVDALIAGRSMFAPRADWDPEKWPNSLVAEVSEYNGGKLLGDRKLLKLVRRSDVFGIYAGTQAIEQAGLPTYTQALEEAAAAEYADQTGCYVGSGGGAFEVSHDFFPLMAESGESLEIFGKELPNTVNPMWLLRSLPNNVLCHVSIRNRLKGPNGCMTNHTTSGILSVIESAWTLREGDAQRVGGGARAPPMVWSPPPTTHPLSHKRYSISIVLGWSPKTSYARLIHATMAACWVRVRLHWCSKLRRVQKSVARRFWVSTLAVAMPLRVKAYFVSVRTATG
jgi:3-oxoacyl-(acyl-carrier-protein) synthase